MARFRRWLPGRHAFETRAGALMVRSEGYARTLGLTRLTIAYNGYCPERGAHNPTGTFKDLEAAPTLAYLREHATDHLVLASAGNTARAFAYASSEQAFPCCLVVAESMLHRLWLPRPQSPAVKTIVVKGSASYADAIGLSEHISGRFGIPGEGGARNVARRDGLGTTLLQYAIEHGSVPDHYVQAVGSGAGAIAAFEAALRLRDDGGFGTTIPKLHLVQNRAYAPIHAAWSRRLAAVVPEDAAAGAPDDVYADVLANAHPPYDAAGGVRSVLEATRGMTYGVDKAAAIAARHRFEELEGLPINEAAACACAGLEMAVAARTIRASDHVLLNITGGGERLIARDYASRPIRADFEWSLGTSDAELRAFLASWTSDFPAFGPRAA